MGVKSTAPFLDLVIEQCQALYSPKNDDEYPHMMIYSLPVPMHLDRPLDHELVSSTVEAGLRRLQNCNVDFIAMPCNTAHQYYDQLKTSLDVPLLNIIDETLDSMPESANRISLLAAPFTIDAGIYEEGIAAAGLEFVHQQNWQDQVTALLNDIKVSKDIESMKQKWLDLLNQVKAAGVDHAVIACTDLNAVSQFVEAPLPMIDATEMLAKATVQKYLKLSQVAV